MKLLLDSCLSRRARDDLAAAGYDVICAGDFVSDPGDGELLAQSEREQRVLITLDKDFGELAVVMGQSHHGILRLVNFSASQQSAICERVLKDHDPELTEGAIVTAEPGRVRVRLAPI